MRWPVSGGCGPHCLRSCRWRAAACGSRGERRHHRIGCEQRERRCIGRADGRYIAFASSANDLVSGDGNVFIDVFVRDLRNGTTTHVSVDTAGGDADSQSFNPAMSGDGRFVAFESAASDLVAGDGKGLRDVFVRDLRPEKRHASALTAPALIPTASASSSISADGGAIAFRSVASDLVPGDEEFLDDVFVRRLGNTTRVSVDTVGGDASGRSTGPAISADGNHVAFESDASDLVTNDGNNQTDVFVRECSRRTTRRASVDSGGGPPNDASFNPSINQDGQFVAFHSFATDLVPGATLPDELYVRDLHSNTKTHVTVSVTGGPGNT